MTEKREKLILGAGIAVFFITIFAISVFKYFRFGFNGFDLAIYNQAFWNTIHGRFFATSINPPSYLGDHAEWLILALAPLYALVPHPLTLVFLKIAAIAISAIPIWLITKLKFSDAKTRLLFPLLWLVNPYVWNLALFEFHLITFAVPLTLFAAYFFLKDRWRAFIITALAILLCREDMAFIVAGFALLAIFETIRRRDSRLLHPEQCRRVRNDIVKWIVIPIVLAATIFVIDQKVIAHFNPDGAYKFFIFYDWLGATIPAIIGAIFAHPLRVLSHIIMPANINFVVALMLPVVFLPFVRARFLLVIIIVSAEYMLTRGGAEGVVLKTQYAAAFLSAAIIATVEGYERLLTMKKPFKMIPKEILPAIVVVASVYIWFVYGPGAGLANGLALPDARAQAIQTAVSLIPKDAPVVASKETLTQLSSRQNVWPMSYVWTGKKQYGTSDYIMRVEPEYLVLDQHDFIYFALVYPNIAWSSKIYPTAAARFRSFLAEGKYGVIFNREGVAVLKRGVGGSLPFVAVRDTMPAIAEPMNIKIGPLNFLGRDQAHLFFSADRPVADDLVIKINNEYYPLGNGLYPATDWKPDEIVEIAPPVASDKMTIQLYTIKGGLNVAADGNLIFSYNAEYPIGNKISLPQ